ncbi:interphotoreceptor retinoid-binding protein [Dictyobacter aurantiacus]|uniref:Interphotoreceptor retinoid-binding protein n=2 Tax=Dictyobacter aurantiacus TaxID=1936993 RepID=A0A401ZRK7_9CHLR|nr:interphotoreceptor retinoid-binding protein [Dictyobacter aurantiacus]
MPHENFTLTTEAQSLILERLYHLLAEHYVVPELVPAAEQTLRQQFGTGEFASYTATDAFCEFVTTHLYEYFHDRHLVLQFHAEARPISNEENLTQAAERQAQMVERETLRNFGFQKVERLEGNIGYLDLRFFSSPAIAGDTAAAAMTLLAHTNAIIIDLRHNDGGENYMAHLLTSYLVEAEPILLNSFSFRSHQRTQQCWTLPYVPGKRSTHQPVYILTSAATASAAEEFAYTLQQLRRAAVIGEKTIGAANPVEIYQITKHVKALIPIGKSLNAVSGTNWEGTGVIPDKEVPAAQALHIAHMEALQKVLADTQLSPAASAFLKKEAQKLIQSQTFLNE